LAVNIDGSFSDLNVNLTAVLLNVGGFLLLYVLLLCLPVGLLARQRGRSFAAGFLLALFLSPIVGALIVWLMGPERQRT
jgi:hypothetical protein